MKTLTELIKNIEIVEVINFNSITISGITYNSLEVQQGNIFCAIRGTATDGNIFIPQAIEKGASAIVTETTPEVILGSVTYIIVEDARKTMALLAKSFYNFENNKTHLLIPINQGLNDITGSLLGIT